MVCIIVRHLLLLPKRCESCPTAGPEGYCPLKGCFAQMSVVRGSREKAEDAAPQWVDTQILGSRVGRGPAGAASLPRLIILPAVLRCLSSFYGMVLHCMARMYLGCKSSQEAVCFALEGLGACRLFTHSTSSAPRVQATGCRGASPKPKLCWGREESRCNPGLFSQHCKSVAAGK